MTDRERLVVELLRLRTDNPSAPREGIRGDSGAVPIRTHEHTCRLRVEGLRCTCYIRSLDELSRCLRLLANGGIVGVRTGWNPEQLELRRQWSAVAGRYILAERRPLVVDVKRFRPVPKPGVEVLGLVNKTDLNHKGDGQTRVLCEMWRADVDLARAQAGVEWLAERFAGPLNVPREYTEAAA